MWKFINTKVQSKNNKKNSKVEKMNFNGEELVDTCEIANAFNCYYSKVSNDLTSNIGHKNIYNIPTKENDKSFFIQPTNDLEILNLIKKLKNNVSPGYDNITNKIIKSMGGFISGPLAHIFNLSIEKSVYPEAFKLAIVKPIYKSGNKRLCNNYRPISLTSNLSKIFEKLLKLRINKFLEKYRT